MYIVIAPKEFFDFVGIPAKQVKLTAFCAQLTKEQFTVLALSTFPLPPDTAFTTMGLKLTPCGTLFLSKNLYTHAKNILTKPSDVV